MVLPSPEFIPDSVIEKRALRLLKEHEERWGVRVSLPIPVELIVERTLGLNLTWVEVQESADEIILARIDPDYFGRPTIQMNERQRQHFNDYFGTEAFSIGHEGGHWVFHYDRGRSNQASLPGFCDSPSAPILCRRLTSEDRREIQAERFAAFLLMPEHLVLPLVNGHDLCRWSTIQQLARACGVSKRAFIRRLEALGRVAIGSDGRIRDPHGEQGAGPLL